MIRSEGEYARVIDEIIPPEPILSIWGKELQRER